MTKVGVFFFRILELEGISEVINFKFYLTKFIEMYWLFCSYSHFAITFITHFYIKIAFAAKKVLCGHYISRRNRWKTTKNKRWKHIVAIVCIG